MESSLLEVGGVLGVSVLRWPAEEHVRRHLAAFRQPRVLLLDDDVQPPALLDDLEDWLRTTASPDDLRARGRELHRRAVGHERPLPTIDEDGLLRVGSSWVDLTPAQTPVVSLLIDHLERVVSYDDIAATYERAGGSTHVVSIRTLLARIGGRVRPVGLELLAIRRRGVLLTQQPRAVA